MKLMKRVSCLALAAVMTLLLSVGALAAHAVVSPQKLEVDGKSVAAQAYNIDGNNYFKLRDVAALLSGTDAQFDVDYDAEKNAVTITTGREYLRIGGELQPLDGADKEAVKSTQTLYLNGKKLTTVKGYNIDGNNFFKLRDLGKVLNFGVDFDEASNTVAINTVMPDIVFTTVDMNGNTWTEACFAGHKLTVINLWAYWCGPCVGEMPDLQKLSEEYAERGVQFLGISNKDYEEGNIAKIAELGITYPCLRYTSAFAKYMDTGFIPVTIFVDGNGKVLERVDGSQSYQEWVELLSKYLDD